jgi:hypothetical protein
MDLVAFVGFRDQRPIEPLLTHALLVACGEQDSFAFGIERNGDPPHSIIRLESQLLQFANFESLSVSTCGLSSCGPNSPIGDIVKLIEDAESLIPPYRGRYKKRTV